MSPDLCLDQEVPLGADVLQIALDVDGSLLSDLLQHAVQNQVCTGPAHPRAGHPERHNI